MTMKKNFIIQSIGVLVFVIVVFMIGMPLLAKSPAGSLSEGGSEVVVIGVIDPDGQSSLWALPADSASGISRQLAAKYPRKTMDGVIFYQVTSWREISHLLVKAHADQGLLIAGLYREVKRLKTSSPDAQLARRVMKLEKRLAEITDSGLR